MLTINLQPFPELSTPRLFLRQLDEGDTDDLFVMRSDEEVMRYVPRPVATSPSDALALIRLVNGMISQNKSITWGITLQGINKVIGTIGFVNFIPEHFRAEVGYMLNPAFQKQGFMQEALTAILDYGFNTLNVHSVQAIVDPDNAASIALLERMHFIREGHFKEDFFYGGKFLDSVYYGLVKKQDSKHAPSGFSL